MPFVEKLPPLWGAKVQLRGFVLMAPKTNHVVSIEPLRSRRISRDFGSRLRLNLA